MPDEKAPRLGDSGALAGEEYGKLALEFSMSYIVTVDAFEGTDAAKRLRAKNFIHLAFADFLARRRAP